MRRKGFLRSDSSPVFTAVFFCVRHTDTKVYGSSRDGLQLRLCDYELVLLSTGKLHRSYCNKSSTQNGKGPPFRLESFGRQTDRPMSARH